jgi:hypothetical protein
MSKIQWCPKAYLKNLDENAVLRLSHIYLVY